MSIQRNSNGPLSTVRSPLCTQGGVLGPCKGVQAVGGGPLSTVRSPSVPRVVF